MTITELLEMMAPLVRAYRKMVRLMEMGDFDIISPDGLKSKLAMTKKEIITKHKEKYSIWQTSDGRWRTKLPDPTKPKGKRPIAKVHLEDLEDAIVEWYTTGRTPDTLEKIYPEWLSYKAKDTTKANAHKLSWVWDKYYDGEAITSRQLSTLDVLDVKIWLLDMIENRPAHSRDFSRE